MIFLNLIDKNCDYIGEDNYTLEQHQLSHHEIISVDLRDIHNVNPLLVFIQWLANIHQEC